MAAYGVLTDERMYTGSAQQDIIPSWTAVVLLYTT